MSLDQSNVIDALGIEEASGRVVLVIRHDAPWDGSDAQLFLLQEKLNAYLSFALDGEMAEAYPHAAAKSVRLRLKCASEPDARTLRFIDVIRKQIAYQHIPFEIAVKA